MTLLFILTAVLILVFTIQGFRVGLVRRAVEFAGVVASFVLATTQAARLAAWIPRAETLPGNLPLYLAWVMVFVLGLAATRLLAWALGKAVRISIVGWLDRLGGAAFGLLAGVLLASVILLALTRAPGGEAVRTAFEAHPATRLVYRAAPSLYALLRRLGADHGEAWQWIEVRARRHAADDSAPAAPPVLARRG